mmetsp:Transcript_3039/g.6519  ORF Transcript_3039/g.6519 Transcript_3039/m.6519 type:complete len:217 (-) Transcript_3039:456-1106(-)
MVQLHQGQTLKETFVLRRGLHHRYDAQQQQFVGAEAVHAVPRGTQSEQIPRRCLVRGPHVKLHLRPCAGHRLLLPFLRLVCAIGGVAAGHFVRNLPMLGVTMDAKFHKQYLGGVRGVPQLRGLDPSVLVLDAGEGVGVICCTQVRTEVRSLGMESGQTEIEARELLPVLVGNGGAVAEEGSVEEGIVAVPVHQQVVLDQFGRVQRHRHVTVRLAGD